MGRKKTYDKPGQPSKFTDEAKENIRKAAAVGANIKQTCYFLSISERTYQNWRTENPEFFLEMELVRERMPLKAKQNIASGLEKGDTELSKWILEKKDPEFKPTSKVEHSGSIDVADLTENMTDKEKTALLALRAARRERIEAESQKLQ